MVHAGADIRKLKILIDDKALLGAALRMVEISAYDALAHNIQAKQIGNDGGTRG